MPISVMLKPASGNCNLRCKYCFYHDLAATRQTENKGYMTRDTALLLPGTDRYILPFRAGNRCWREKTFFAFSSPLARNASAPA